MSLPREGESIFGPRARADYVIDENGCWVWQKATFRGYAHHGDGLKPHRLYYERAHGLVPEGCDVHHTCKNRVCVNPAHLEAIDARTHDALHWLGERGLTVEDLHDIRALGRKNIQAGEVAERYGICKASVYYYWRGQSWADLLGEPGPSRQSSPYGRNALDEAWLRGRDATVEYIREALEVRAAPIAPHRPSTTDHRKGPRDE